MKKAILLGLCLSNCGPDLVIKPVTPPAHTTAHHQLPHDRREFGLALSSHTTPLAPPPDPTHPRTWTLSAPPHKTQTRAQLCSRPQKPPPPPHDKGHGGPPRSPRRR